MFYSARLFGPAFSTPVSGRPCATWLGLLLVFSVLLSRRGVTVEWQK